MAATIIKFAKTKSCGTSFIAVVSTIDMRFPSYSLLFRCSGRDSYKEGSIIFKAIQERLIQISCFLAIFVLATDVSAQRAVLDHKPDGTISVIAQGRWPLEQVVEVLRKE